MSAECVEIGLENSGPGSSIATKYAEARIKKLPDKLPPANPDAQGLFLTAEEYDTVVALLTGEPDIVQARIYGSRQTGIRRRKTPCEPLDIDIAIRVHAPCPDEISLVFLDVRRRLQKCAGPLRVQVEDLDDSSSEFFSDRQNGVVILDRRSR